MDGMMRDVYKNRFSRAEIRPAQVEGAEGVLELLNLTTISSHRRKGHASQLMQRIVDDADRNYRVLMLRPEPFGLTGITDLVSYYKKFGFIVIQELPVIMARQPKINQLAS